MRNIKFRGKTKQGKWLYGSLCQTKTIISILSEKDMETTPLDLLGVRIVENLVENDSIGQFTGMKDKKGDEIYEGDILRNSPRTVTYIAEWYEKTGYWRAKHLSALHDDVLHNICDQFEIIGNIYDNKELL